MAKKKDTFDTVMNVPVTTEMKDRIAQEADREERKPADMGRVLWREALEAREAKSETARA